MPNRVTARRANAKTTWVADYLHEVIPLSRFEKVVVATDVFNRLHNILQNSTAFLTYPSNRTSRFSHSLGCMHLAGEIFRSAISNASGEDRYRFLKEVQGEVARIRAQESFSLMLEGDGQFAVEESVEPSFDDAIYLDGQPGGLETVEVDIYSATLQAVRLAGLLHDIGHPPFSHVTEYALERVYFDVDLVPTAQRTARQNEFLEALQHRESRPLHEHLGEMLARLALHNAWRHLEAEPSCRLAMLITIFLAEAILEEKGGTAALQALHAIVSGDIDADRLDYVSRDLSMSGVSKEPFRYRRLISSFELRYIQLKGAERPTFLPSARALSSLEEFFQKRMSLYRYVVYHHRVAKTDALLYETLLELLSEYLNEPEPPQELNELLLPYGLEGLWRPMKPEAERQVLGLARRKMFVQWDDAWLLSMLRRTLYLHGASLGANLHDRLRELLTNTKSYFSLYKRADSFLETDKAFAEALVKGDALASILETVNLLKDQIEEALSGSVREVEHRRRKLTADFARWAAWRKQVELVAEGARDHNGFLVAELSDNLLPLKRDYQLDFEKLVRMAVKRVVKHPYCRDAFVSLKRLKPGISGDQLLVSGPGEVVQLSHVSRLADDLLRVRHFFPPFYVYAAPPDRGRAFAPSAASTVRQQIGVELAACLVEMLREKRDSLGRSEPKD